MLKFVILVSLVVMSTVLSQEQPHCIWNKICYKTYNCPYDGPGEPLNDQIAIEILRQRCSDIYNDSEKKVFLILIDRFTLMIYSIFSISISML